MPINIQDIKARKSDLLDWRQATPYGRQKSALEKELTGFLGGLVPPFDLQSATPDAVVNFFIWKDNFGKRKVHQEGCCFSGQKGNSQCTCPKRLAYSTVNSLIGKLRSIFCLHGRGSDDSPIPGFGNHAASKAVKDYLTMIREEQLRARITPTQAQPFFTVDFLALASYIVKRLMEGDLFP